MKYRDAGAAECWLCGEPRSAAHVPFYPRRFKTGPAVPQFQLDTAILTVSLISVLLAVARVAPGPSLLALVIAAGAYLRTGRMLLRRESPTLPSTLRKVVAFAQSVLVVLAMLSAATFVFGVVLVVSAAIGMQLSAWLDTSLVEFSCGVGVALASFLAIATLGFVGFQLKF